MTPNSPSKKHRLFSIWFVIVSLLILNVRAESRDIQALWLTTNSNSVKEGSAFERQVMEYLQLNSALQVKQQTVAMQNLTEQLASLQQQENKDPIFIQCSIDEYKQLLADPKAGQLLSELQIELYNPRLISFPFYLLMNSASDPSRRSTLEIALLKLSGESWMDVEVADVLTMISEVLGRPKNSLKLFEERGPYPAAKKLFDGTYQLVGIYEEEPSVLLDEFNVNLTQELKAPSAVFFAPEPNRVEYQLHEIAPHRMSYVFFRYQDPFFADQNHSSSNILLALSPETVHKFPIVLSNLKSASPDSEPEFLRALSYSDFLMLPQISVSENEKYLVQRLYLLDAFLNDSENRWKGLGFLGFLLLMKDKKTSPEEKEIYENKCNLLLKKYGLEKLTAQSLLNWLGLKVPALNRRELFTSDVSKLYQDALQKIDQGLKSTGKERVQFFEEARNNLIAALLQGSEPKSVKGSRGLWSAADYNPYYDLARVTLYLEVEQQRSTEKQN